jgi:hypothetical protein
VARHAAERGGVEKPPAHLRFDLFARRTELIEHRLVLQHADADVARWRAGDDERDDRRPRQVRGEHLHPLVQPPECFDVEIDPLVRVLIPAGREEVERVVQIERVAGKKCPMTNS